MLSLAVASSNSNTLGSVRGEDAKAEWNTERMLCAAMRPSAGKVLENLPTIQPGPSIARRYRSYKW